MAELALTVQDKYHLSTEVLNCLLESILNEYMKGSKPEGVVIYEQSDRGLQTESYQQSITSNEFSTINYVIIGLELAHLGYLSYDGFKQLVDAHYADQTLRLGEVPEIMQMLREELDEEFDELIDEEVFLTSFFEDPEGLSVFDGLFSQDFVMFWNDFIWWAQRYMLRLTFTTLDCVGEGFYYGHSTYFTSRKVHELLETHMNDRYQEHTPVSDYERLARRFPRQFNYESPDWDFHTHRANALRGGGFSCFS